MFQNFKIRNLNFSFVDYMAWEVIEYIILEYFFIFIFQFVWIDFFFLFPLQFSKTNA